MATFVRKALLHRRFPNLPKCELCSQQRKSVMSVMIMKSFSSTMSISQHCAYRSLSSLLVLDQPSRQVHSSTSLTQPVEEKNHAKQLTFKHTSSAIKPRPTDTTSTVESPAGQPINNLNERVEAAIQSTLDHVTPCPIEPQDGNKEDAKEAGDPKETQWREQNPTLSQLPSLYLQLSKSRLTGLVTISALAGYCMAPGVFEVSTCALMALGTCLTSCSANTINQYFEVPYDSQMARTRNRVLVKGLLSPLHAVLFATAVGSAGVGILALTCNPLSAMIAASSWMLYVSVYTPMKRVSILNTWVGAVVGALPPAIGWAASTGVLAPGALLMAGFLYCWQFPHFNALSWNLRSDYSRGGYRMMATTNPSLCRRVALRHCLAMVGLCTLAPVLDLTTWTFALDSLPLNLWLVYLGVRFYRRADSRSAKQLFKFTLLHLPLLMLLLIISKKGLHPD